MNDTKRSMKFAWTVVVVMFCAGSCAHLREAPKVIWGSSTKALEEARLHATRNIYSGNLDACFNEVLKIAQKEKLEVFIRDAHKKCIVVMKVKGSIDTTEVAVFFSDVGAGRTEVEVTSLSSQAQETASNIIFTALGKTFSPVK